MIDIIKWFLVLEIFGLIGLPIAYRLFAALPSRGYALAKPLALLLVGYAFWLLGSFKFLMNTTSAVVFVLLAVACASACLAWRDRIALRFFWRQNRALIFASESVFIAFFALWVVYRAYNPDIFSTEKPMDFLFLNSLLRSPELPPRDPWLSGYAISYYYFGYLLMAVLTRLSGVTASVGFSLGLASIMGLTASGAYTIVHDLITLRRNAATPNSQLPTPNLQPLVFALLGALFVVFIGNLEGVLELLTAHGIGSPGFYGFFGIKDLPPPHDAQTWYPDGNWWWWRASRVLATPSTEIIDEFPFFSFVIADLHPHVMALPFVMVAIALALNTLIQPSDVQLPSSEFQKIWLYPILLGALGFLNSWDFPTYTGLVILAFAINRQRALGSTKAFWTEVVRFVLIVGGLGIVCYLPFYLTFSSQASGLKWADFFDKRTTFAQMAVFWGLFFFISGSYILTDLRASFALVRHNRTGWIYGGICAFVLCVTGLFQWWMAVAATFFIALGLPLLIRSMISTEQSTTAERTSARTAPSAVKFGLGGAYTIAKSQRDDATTFALLAALIALALIFLVEFVFIRDSFGTRMNTVFKFYYQAWILLALASAYFAYEIANGKSPTRPACPAGSNARERSRRIAARAAWLTAFGLLFAGTLVYPLAAFATQTNGLQSDANIDGMVNFEKNHPGDAAAIAWLKQYAPSDAVIVEGVGGDYSDAGRVSEYTSLPTVIGWVGHELQWRGSGDQAGQREQDVKTIYTSPDARQTQTLLKQYGATYVFVGDIEKAKYGNAIPLLRFGGIVEQVYNQQGTIILRVK